MVLAIWQAVRRATRRDLGTLFSFRLNHFFLFVALMIWGALVSHEPPRSAYPILLLLFVLILGPLSSDPLVHAPATRLEIWPLNTRQRLWLRLTTLLLSPVMWLALGLALFVSWSMAAMFLVVAVTVQAAIVACQRMARTHPGWNPFAFMPRLPGRLGDLARGQLRQMLSVLDTYLAIALSIGGTAYRLLAPAPDPAAFAIFSLLVALALSTAAQVLFGLDSTQAVIRYRILPLRGHEILFAKDAALLLLLTILTAPLDLRAGVTYGFTALAIGHFPSVHRRLPQLRWRFLGGRMISGVPQAVTSLVLGFAASHGYPWVIGVAGALWVASLFAAGQQFDRPGWAGWDR